MRTLSGYIITEDGAAALRLFGTQGVRYAASLSDGRGFAAFDTDDDIGEGGMILAGQMLTAVDEGWEAPPDGVPPEEWARRQQNRPEGPKRQLARGDERFVLYPALPGVTADELRDYLISVPGARAAALVMDADWVISVLIETGPDWRCPLEPTWDATVVEYRDVRIGVPA